MNSIVFYEILLYLNVFFFTIFSVAQLTMGIFKIRNLPFPVVTLATEYMLLAFLCFLEGCRIIMARTGKLTEKSVATMISVGLSIPIILGTLYFLFWQTFVLRLEMILCSIQLILVGLEVMLAIFHMFKVFKPKTY